MTSERFLSPDGSAGMSPDEEATWNSIVSQFRRVNDESQDPQPHRTFADFDPLEVRQELSTWSSSAAQPLRSVIDPGATPLQSGATPLQSTGPRDYTLDEDEDEFRPPIPEPIGPLPLSTLLGWLGAIGAPRTLFLLALLWRTAPALLIYGLILVFFCSCGYLLSRLPRRRSDDHDDHMGAQR